MAPVLWQNLGLEHARLGGAGENSYSRPGSQTRVVAQLGRRMVTVNLAPGWKKSDELLLCRCMMEKRENCFNRNDDDDGSGGVKNVTTHTHQHDRKKRNQENVK